VVYLADDERRDRAFEQLRVRVGLSPAALLDGPIGALREVCGLGIRADAQARKLQACARLAMTAAGDLSRLDRLPLADARAVLRRYPAIGEPGADLILLRAGLHAVPALDSNGVRVLVRLGLAAAAPGYAAAYRSAVAAVGRELPAAREPLLRAYLLLRAHGHGLCRRPAPECSACPLASRCLHALGGR
jgi:endonuclease-3